MEICLLAKGRQVYKVGKREYSLAGGDLFVTLPDEPHSTGNRPEEKSVLYWLLLHLPPKQVRLLSLPPRKTRQVRGALFKIKRRHFKGNAGLRQILDSIITAYYDGRMPLKNVYIESKLLEFITQVIHCAGRAGESALSEPLGRVVALIDGHLGEKLSVDRLARAAGLSPSRLKARFKKETGVPPAEYVLRKKIDKAKELLQRKGRTVTDAAFELDFSSSQYFATVFKRYTGQTPREYRTPNDEVNRYR
jgi:AraC-like DNA-binding protein